MSLHVNRGWHFKFFKDKTGGATFSECGLYRYSLYRHFSEKPMPRFCNFIMLNPSTADEVKNDPTVERCERRARMWGFDGFVVTNIFAWRSTDPKVLSKLDKPIGKDNDHYILREAQCSPLVICAWGKDGAINKRGSEVAGMLRTHGVRLYALRVSEKTGQPWHPLYLPYSCEPFEWNPA